jgi:hypothetical protein
MFKDVKRGKPSTIADFAANGIVFLPQSNTMKAAEIFALHVVGKLIEKYGSDASQVHPQAESGQRPGNSLIEKQNS